MVSLSSINIYSYLIEAAVVKSIDLLQGQGESPTIKLNTDETVTVTASPEFSVLSDPKSTLIVAVAPEGTPGDAIHISQKTLAFPVRPSQLAGSVAGFDAVPSTMEGVTTATLAPCLAAFLSEFFVYHARENSVIPKRISNNKKSTNAVSIKVCPSRLLKVLICLSKMPPGHVKPGG